jgi:hypothetical protein
LGGSVFSPASRAEVQIDRLYPEVLTVKYPAALAYFVYLHRAGKITVSAAINIAPALAEQNPPTLHPTPLLFAKELNGCGGLGTAWRWL